jgi:hypothetical protein
LYGIESHIPEKDKKRSEAFRPLEAAPNAWSDDEVPASASVETSYYSIHKYDLGLPGAFSYGNAWSSGAV